MDVEMMDLSLDDIIRKNSRPVRKGSGRAANTHPRDRTEKLRSRPSLAKTKGASVSKVVFREGKELRRNLPRSVPRSTKVSLGPIRMTNDFVKSSQNHNKTVKSSGSGIIVSLKNDRYEKGSDRDTRKPSGPRTQNSSRSQDRSRSRDRGELVERRRVSPERRSERLEINITNEKAVVPPNTAVAERMGLPAMAPTIQAIPTIGINTASQFRTPMAVMDIYTGRYNRPSLEPYRPPPMMQQFYRSLADVTANGQIPSTYAPPLHPASTLYQQNNSSTGSVIRKPFD